MRTLRLASMSIVLICGCVTRAEMTKPHTLLFSPITPEYLQDTTAEWKVTGFDGFLLSRIMHDWSSDVWATDGDATTRGADDQTFMKVKACNDACRKQGITDNFIKVAFYSHVPLWTDDAAWEKCNENFRQAARFAKTTGCRGIALDIEYVGEQYNLDWDGYDYQGYTRVELRQAAVKRGRELVRAMLEGYPDMVFLTLPEGIRYYGPLATDLFVGMVKGMAEADAPGGLHLLTEHSYKMVSTLGLIHYVYSLETKILSNLDESTAKYWKRECSIALGGWPLGYYRDIRDEKGNRIGYSGRVEKFGDRLVGSYADKSSNYSPEDFRNQYAGMLLGSGKYCWIYGHGATWWHFTPADVSRYGEVSNSTLPVDDRLDEFKAVLKEKWMASDRMRDLGEKVRGHESDEFVRMLGFVERFKVIGPFGGKGIDIFNEVFPPEKQIDLNASYAGSAGQVRWQTLSTDPTGYLDFADHLSPSDWVCAYAYCTASSPQARSAQIRLGSNDTATLWFNGERILSKNGERSASPDTDIVPVRIKTGENTILIKVCNTELNWGLYLRISNDNGTAAEHLTFWP
ncbi:MAG: hypothetical protein P8Z79_13890 [Sedimentisphaerales bacterium]